MSTFASSPPPSTSVRSWAVRFARRPRAHWASIAAIAAAAAVVVPVATARTQDVNSRGKSVLEFQKRVTEYVALHKREAGRQPPLKETDSPAQIASREKQLGEAIRAARTGARAGDLFEPVAAIIAHAVQTDWRKRSPSERKGLLTEVPKNVRVEPNRVYPTTLPLATSPPALIEALPRLPDELEYRFVGRHLILRDVKANLIVDVLRHVIPASS